jgi:hypothetical protein
MISQDARGQSQAAEKKALEERLKRMYPTMAGPKGADAAAVGARSGPQDDERAAALDRMYPTMAGKGKGHSMPPAGATEERKGAAGPGLGGEASGPLPPPTSEPVNPEQLYEALDFQPEGQGAAVAGGAQAKSLFNEVTKVAEKKYGEPGKALDGGTGDAFRQALWSYRMVKSFGPEAAKAFGDERARGAAQKDEGVTLMGLYNNAVGRELAAGAQKTAGAGEAAVEQAMKAGKLQVSPFKVQGAGLGGQEPMMVGAM